MFDTLSVLLAQSDGPPSGAAPASPGTGDTGAGEQTGTQQPAPGTGTGKEGNSTPPGFGLIQLLPFILIIVVFWMMIMGGQRREKKKRAQMLQSLKKNDKVVTIGGIIGTVVEIRDNEIVLKVDESNNTRMRFSRSAIQGVVGQND